MFKKFVVICFISLSTMSPAKASPEYAQCLNIVNEFLLNGIANCIEKYGQGGLRGTGGLFKGFLLNKCVEDVNEAAQELTDYCNELFRGGSGGISFPETLDNNFNFSKKPKVKLQLNQMQNLHDRMSDKAMDKIDAL